MDIVHYQLQFWCNHSMIEKYYNRAVTSLLGTARVQGLYDMEKLSTFWEKWETSIAHF